MHIETDRLILRYFTPADAADLHEILGDDETMKNCEPAYDFDKTQSFLESFCIAKKAALAAVQKESGKVIGYILFKPLEDGIYEIGWFFNKSHWRQGYAYESCSALIACAFDSLNVHKIVAETIDSQKSVKLMEKLGMKREGVQRSQTKDNDGNWTDLYLYGILRDDR